MKSQYEYRGRPYWVLNPAPGEWTGIVRLDASDKRFDRKYAPDTPEAIDGDAIDQECRRLIDRDIDGGHDA